MTGSSISDSQLEIRNMYARTVEFNDQSSYTSWCPWYSSMVSVKKGGRSGVSNIHSERFADSRKFSTNMYQQTYPIHFCFDASKPTFFCTCLRVKTQERAKGVGHVAGAEIRFEVCRILSSGQRIPGPPLDCRSLDTNHPSTGSWINDLRIQSRSK